MAGCACQAAPGSPAATCRGGAASALSCLALICLGKREEREPGMVNTAQAAARPGNQRAEQVIQRAEGLQTRADSSRGGSSMGVTVETLLAAGVSFQRQDGDSVLGGLGETAASCSASPPPKGHRTQGERGKSMSRCCTSSVQHCCRHCDLPSIAPTETRCTIAPAMTPASSVLLCSMGPHYLHEPLCLAAFAITHPIISSSSPMIKKRRRKLISLLPLAFPQPEGDRSKRRERKRPFCPKRCLKVFGVRHRHHLQILC